MTLKIVLSNTVKFKVRGTVKDATGNDNPFDFSLTCRRLSMDEIQERIKDMGESKIGEFVIGLIEDWTGVRDENDQPIAYSDEAYRRINNIPGLGLLIYRTYLQEVGAKEKN